MRVERQQPPVFRVVPGGDTLEGYWVVCPCETDSRSVLPDQWLSGSPQQFAVDLLLKDLPSPGEGRGAMWLLRGRRADCVPDRSCIRNWERLGLCMYLSAQPSAAHDIRENLVQS